jgi:hypothetical protein
MTTLWCERRGNRDGLVERSENIPFVAVLCMISIEYLRGLFFDILDVVYLSYLKRHTSVSLTNPRNIIRILHLKSSRGIGLDANADVIPLNLFLRLPSIPRHDRAQYYEDHTVL